MSLIHISHPAIKMGVGLLLVFAAFGFGDWRTYGKRALAFFGLGALLGGLVIAGGFLFGSPTAAGRGYIVTGIPLWLLIPVSLLSVKGCEALVRRIKDAISREDAVPVSYTHLEERGRRFKELVMELK